MLFASIPLFSSRTAKSMTAIAAKEKQTPAKTPIDQTSKKTAEKSVSGTDKDMVKVYTKDEYYDHMIAISNRHYCSAPDPVNNHLDMERFLDQIKRVCEIRPKKIILREKDLSLEDYIRLSERVLRVCEYEDMPLCLHQYIDAAEELDIPDIHLPFSLFTKAHDEYPDFEELTVSTSIHSVEEAILAQKLQADSIIAGTIFPTTCKPGLEGRGLEFLREVVSSVTIPVYAIGGITIDNMQQILETEAAGGCSMSGFFTN